MNDLINNIRRGNSLYQTEIIKRELRIGLAVNYDLGMYLNDLTGRKMKWRKGYNGSWSF